MLAVGKRFDEYLNLFGAGTGEGPQVDALFKRIETVLVEQHRQGGIAAGAKHAIDRTLDAMQRAAPSRSSGDRKK